MSKKNLIIIIIILLLVVVGLVSYMLVQKAGKEEKPEEGKVEVGKITEAYFETFPAGTEITPGLQGAKTDKFKKDDLVAITGEVEAPGKTMLTFQILDENAEEVLAGGAPGMELKGSGGFGMCCISIPQKEGKYNLRLLLDDKEAKILPFEVVE